MYMLGYTQYMTVYTLMYGVTRILFLHTVFSFLTPPYDVQSWEVPEHIFKLEHDKKSQELCPTWVS
jgi:hypothetical protein